MIQSTSFTNPAVTAIQMILLIDNFDSFAANIARYFRRFGLDTRVIRNNAITVEKVQQLRPQAIVISPGPCRPEQAGNTLTLIRNFAGNIPILGICLGHQAIAMNYGTRIIRAPEPVHGRQSTLIHQGHFMFHRVPEKFDACRYHSLVVDENSLAPNFEVTCRTADGIIMAIADNDRQLFGLQFHPESILTPFGFQILNNFVQNLGHCVTAEETRLYESETMADKQTGHNVETTPIIPTIARSPKNKSLKGSAS